MKTYKLQAAVGIAGTWEDWATIDTIAFAVHANALVAKAPRRWRIIEA